MSYTPVKKIITTTDNTVNILKVPVYVVSIALLHILYFLVFFGIYSVDSNYIRYLSTFIQLFISLLLIIRFNPFRTIAYSPSDGIIIFGAGMFYLTNTVFTETFMSNIEGTLGKWVPWLVPYLPKPSSKDDTKHIYDNTDISIIQL